MKYKNYIEGDGWKEKSGHYLEENPICELCHKHKATEVHHTSYKRIGEEDDKDLMSLCNRCHIGIHAMPPVIKDEIQLKKALKIMKYFVNYPVIKTLVLNDISDKYYDGVYMLSETQKESDETAFFVQNLLEMLYEDGISLGKDLIEETYALCIKYKIQASKTKRERKKKTNDLTKKYESGEIQYIDVRYTTTKKIDQTIDEIIENKIKNFCLGNLQDRQILRNAKSYMNSNYYGGKIFFNREGIVTATQFYLKIKQDNLQKELFAALGGDISKLLEEDENGI